MAERFDRELSECSAAKSLRSDREIASRAQMMTMRHLRFHVFMGRFPFTERSSAASMAARAHLSGSMVPGISSENPEKRAALPARRPNNRMHLRLLAGGPS
jgi:hypothetical protein